MRTVVVKWEVMGIGVDEPLDAGAPQRARSPRGAR